MNREERDALRRDGAPHGFEEEWRTSGKFRMMVRERLVRETGQAVSGGAGCDRDGHG